MTVHTQKRRTPSEIKAAKDVKRDTERSQNLRLAGLPQAQPGGQFVELFDQVLALAVSVAEQSRKFRQLKGVGAGDLQSIEAYLQSQRQVFLKYDAVELVGEAWELKRIMMTQSSAIASLKGDSAKGDVKRDQFEASMGEVDRVKAFFDARRLIPSNDALDDTSAYVVHLLAERLWRRRNGNIPISVAATIAWLVLPGYERRQWLGRAAIATIESAGASLNPASILEKAAKVAD
jgi:hypothetical protein